MASNDGDNYLNSNSCNSASCSSSSTTADTIHSKSVLELNCPVTETRRFHFAHRWTIDNFAKLYYYNISLSSKFDSPFHDDLSFQLALAPKATQNGTQFVSFILDKCYKNMLDVNLKLSILDADNKKNYTKEFEMEMSPLSSICADSFICKDVFVDIETLLPDEKLVIYAEISYDGDIENVDSMPEKAELEKRALQSLIYDLSQLNHNSDIFDAAFRVGVSKENVFTHKAILAGRSPIFQTLFELDCSDVTAENKPFEEPNVDLDTFKELLQYAYSGKLSHREALIEKAANLFVVADKFDLDQLKEMIEELLCSSISSGSITKLLELAHKYNINKLKEQIVEYIKSYSICITSSNNLQLMLEQRADLFYDVFAQLLNHCSQSRGYISATPLLNESSWSHTKTKVFKFAHKWRIDKFSICNANSICLESSKFSPPKDEQFKFHLRLFLKNTNSNCADYLSLHLYVSNYGDYAPKIQFKASILDANGELCNTKIIRKAIYVKGMSLGFADFLFFSDLSQYLVKDKFTIYCEIEIMQDPVLHSGKITSNLNAEKRIAQDFGTLLDSGKLSDVVFIVGGETKFYAHKVILVARSSIFASMFKTTMLEQKENRVHVSDVSVDTFEVMLKFIYTGQLCVPVDQINFEKLLLAAEKYQLATLKNICEFWLAHGLAPETVGHLLMLSEQFNAKYLKAKAIEYIQSCENSDLLHQNDSLMMCMKNYPALFNEVFCQLLQNLV